MYHKKVNIVSVSLAFGTIIYLCILILSYTHAASLFERSGYRGILAHIGVVGIELTFILGTLITVWSQLIGKKVSTASKFVTGLGVTINLYSNITSGIAANGQQLTFYRLGSVPINEAVLIGALIPLLSIAAGKVIAEAISQNIQKRQEEAEKRSEDLGLQRNSSLEKSPKQEEHEERPPNVRSLSELREVIESIPRFSQIKKAYDEHKREHGESLGRVRLAKKAGVSLSEAQKFLTQIKSIKA